MENLIIITSVESGDDLHSHWDNTAEFIKQITYITDLICITGGLISMVSISIHFWQFRHGQKRHTIKKHSCVRLSRLILRQRMKQYFKTNPLGPAGVVRGVTWLQKCHESKDKDRIYQNDRNVVDFDDNYEGKNDFQEDFTKNDDFQENLTKKDDFQENFTKKDDFQENFIKYIDSDLENYQVNIKENKINTEFV